MSWTKETLTAVENMRQLENAQMDKNGYALILHNTDALKGHHWLLEARIEESDDEEIDLQRQETLREVVVAARVLGQGDMQWFLQGESSHWIMIEFWTKDQNYVLDRSMKIAEHVGWELSL